MKPGQTRLEDGRATGPGSGAVVICTRDRPQLLSRCLASLARQDWPAGWHVLVVDNSARGSASESFALRCDSLPEGSRYVQRPRPGLATVRNAAVDECAGVDRICFLDDDMVVPSGWIRHMSDTVRIHPGALVRSPVARVDHVPDDPADLDGLAGRLVVEEEATPAGTGGLLISTHLVRAEPFDTRYDLSGGEDIDLLLRLERAGVASVVVAGTLALEEDRWIFAPPHVVGREYVRMGRLYLQVRQWNGLSTWQLRTSALILLAPTAAARSWYRIRGNSRRARQLGRATSTRIGLVLGPRAAPRAATPPSTEG